MAREQDLQGNESGPLPPAAPTAAPVHLSHLHHIATATAVPTAPRLHHRHPPAPPSPRPPCHHHRQGSGTAPRIGPKPKTSGPLRYAFVQTMGPNSVPRGTSLADFDGGRVTQYQTRRPNSPLPATRMGGSVSAVPVSR